VTGVPTGPSFGLISVMATWGTGASVTVNVGPSAVWLPTCTFTAPVVAPLGTFTTNLVVEALLMVAFVPLKVTVFSDLVELKLVPVIVTLVPVGPTLGLMPLMVSCSLGSGVTVKESSVAVCPFAVTFTGPLVAPCGTVTTSLVVEALLIVALVPLN